MSVANTLEVKITGNTADLQKNLRKATTDVAKWGAASVAAATAAAAAIVKSGLSSADALAKQARQLGATSDELARVRRAADMAGISQGQLETATRALTTRMGQAIQGTGGAADAMRRLGLDAQQVASMPLPERIQAINNALKENIPATERASVAAQLFGERGALAMAQMSPETIAEASRQVDRLGGSLSEVQAAQIEAANDAMSQMGVLTTGVAQRLASQFAPALEGIANLFFDAAGESNGFEDAVKKAYDMAITGAAFVIDAVDGIKRVFQVAADFIIAGWSFVFEKIATLSANVLRGLSKMPGVDFSDTISTLDSFAQTSGSIVDSALNNIASTLEEPLAGAKFQQFVADAEAASLAAAEAAVAAQRSVSGGIEMGQAEDPATIKQRKELEKRLENIRKSMLTEQELMAEKLELELATLQEGYDAKLLQEEEFLRQREELIFNYEDAITQTQKEAADARIKLAEAEAAAKRSIMSGMFNMLSGLMNTNSKKMFEIGKKAAISQAAVKGGEAIQSAWSAGMSVGGPWAPVVAAGYAGAAALVSANQINSIRGQQFGGGGGAPTPAGQGSSGIAAPTGGAGGGGGGGGQTTVVNLVGDTFGRQQMRDFIELANDATADGGRLLLA